MKFLYRESRHKPEPMSKSWLDNICKSLYLLKKKEKEKRKKLRRKGENKGKRIIEKSSKNKRNENMNEEKVE